MPSTVAVTKNAAAPAAMTSASEPTFIEHYGEKFDPETGFGDIEVWFPVKA